MTSVQYHVHMDKKTFRAFAMYDTFILKKHARLPLIFLAIMGGFGLIAAFSGKEQSWLIAGVLLLIGLGMPAVYVGTFFSQIRKQEKKFKLDEPRPVYTVTLSGYGITVHNDQQQQEDVQLKWDKLYKVIRRKDAWYLYAVPTKAFILPDKDASAPPAQVAKLMQKCLPEKREKK